jgi:hypothetical protein
MSFSILNFRLRSISLLVLVMLQLQPISGQGWQTEIYRDESPFDRLEFVHNTSSSGQKTAVYWENGNQLSFAVLEATGSQLEQVRIAFCTDKWSSPIDISAYCRRIDCGLLIQLDPTFGLTKFSGISKFALSFRFKNSTPATEHFFDCNDSWNVFLAKGMKEFPGNSSPSKATEPLKPQPSTSLSLRLSELKGTYQTPTTPLPEGINAFVKKNCTSPLSGSGSGSGSGDYRLGNRSAVSRPKPVYSCEDEGRVVVKVYVDRNGKVLSAEPGASGSTTASTCLFERAQEAAMRTIWTADPNAPQTQVGTVIYRFEIN